MNNIIREIEAAQLRKLPEFKVGDTVVVQLEVKEGTRTRIQAYEGLVIAKRNRGLNSAFTVRKISHGEGVERVFQSHSPMIKGIEVKRHGHVRKAKLYHLRGLTGKSARIRERLNVNFDESLVVNMQEDAANDKANDTANDSANTAVNQDQTS